MFSGFATSWQLVKASWAVLRTDKELILFPIISGFTMIIILLVFFIPFAAMTGLFAAMSGVRSDSAGGEVIGAVIAFIFYLISYTVNIFFNVALVGAAMIRLDGGDPTFGDGLKIARDRFGVIVQYAAISATVGLVLQYLRDRGGFVGSILASLGGLAWNVTTFLVVPILAVKNVGPVDAIKESTALLKRTWGEQIVGGFSMGMIFGLMFLLIFLVMGALLAVAFSMESMALGVVTVLVFIVVFMALGILSSALGGVYQAALYRYAETGIAPTNFDIDMIKGAFKEKNKNK